MPKNFFRLSLALAGISLLLSGCTLPWKKTPPAATGTPAGRTSTSTPAETKFTDRLKKFNNYDQLAEFLAANNNPEISGVTAVSAPATETGANSLGYSADNGADRPDIIKADGNYVYALIRNELSIIKAAPAAEAKVISKITFKSRPQEIFLNGNFLAVFGVDDQIYTQTVAQSFRRRNPYTFFKVFDLSNPADPKQVRDLDFEGSYFEARLAGDYVYFVTRTAGSYLAGEPLLPRVIEEGQVLSAQCVGAVKCFAPDVFYFDTPYDSYDFADITAINIKNNDEEISGQTYLLNGGQDLYVSSKNIYITYSERLDGYGLEQQAKREAVYAKLAAADQDKIAKIEASDSFVLNNNEKKIKVAQIVDRYLDSLSADDRTAIQTGIDEALKPKLAARENEAEKTVIHKLGIADGKIQYLAMGQVSGRALNRFSMDESGDYFRLATTRSQEASRLVDLPTDSYSNIYVLDANLKPVGSLENLATSERIDSARFLADRVYLLTAKPGEPLYVIGLQDPAKPAVLGALKVPGLSNYLQPADANGSKLLGLGRETEDIAGVTKLAGLKLSLYDFSDLSKPKELDSYRLGDSTSESIALTDHAAFFYSAGKNLLSVPAVLRDNGRVVFAGSLVFTIEGDRLKLKGRVDHSAGGHYSQPDFWNGYAYYDNTVKRSLYINEDLYTFSNKFLQANAISGLEEKGKLELTSGGDDYIITTPPAGAAASTTASDLTATSTPIDPAAALDSPGGDTFYPASGTPGIE